MRTRFPMDQTSLVEALKDEGLLGQGIVPWSFNLEQYNTLLRKTKGKMLLPAKDGNGLMMRSFGRDTIASVLSERYRVVASTLTQAEESKLRQTVGRR